MDPNIWLEIRDITTMHLVLLRCLSHNLGRLAACRTKMCRVTHQPPHWVRTRCLRSAVVVGGRHELYAWAVVLFLLGLVWRGPCLALRQHGLEHPRVCLECFLLPPLDNFHDNIHEESVNRPVVACLKWVYQEPPVILCCSIYFLQIIGVEIIYERAKGFSEPPCSSTFMCGR